MTLDVTITYFNADEHMQDVIDLCKEMHAESLYNVLDLSVSKLMTLFLEAENMHDNPYFFRVVLNGNHVIGFMLGLAQEHFCSLDTYAIDLLLYVQKEWRGSAAGDLLLEAYLVWCDENEIKLPMIGSTTNIDLERTKAFYERHGFKCVGHNFII